MTDLKPIEQAAAQLEAAQAEVVRLEQVLFQLDRDRAAARKAGDNDRHAHLNAQVGEANIALRLARVAVEEARGRVQRDKQHLNQIRSAVAMLSNEERRLTKEHSEALERAQALALDVERVQAKLVDARRALAVLEPPEQPAPATPVAEPQPAPRQPTEPQYEQPARTITMRGQPPIHLDRQGNCVDAWGRPLPGAATPKPEPAKSEPQVQTAPSLWD